MGNHRIEAIVFDLGQVLIDFDHAIAAKRILPFSDKSPEEIFELFFDSPLTGLFEEGKISPQDFFAEVKKMLNLKLDYAGFLPIWNEIFFFTEKNRQVYQLAKSLKGRYKVALLSNINVLHFAYLQKNFPVFAAFDTVLTSFELGLRKPDPLIYQKALQVLGVSLPARVFYTDDRPELVAKARELGLRSVVFKGLQQLKRDLENSGVDTD
jgi:putative hydrolase of the HAD superfamily